MLKPKIWIFFSLFASGVIAGLSYLLIFPGEEDPRALDSKTEISHSAGKQNPIPSASFAGTVPLSPQLAGPSDFADLDVEGDLTFAANKLRDDGDMFLQAGNFMSAAKHYKKLQQLNGRFTSDLSIRQGICCEFDDQPGAAAAHYQRAIESNPPVNHRLLALSGLSRTWIERGNRSEALRILCEMFLESLSAVPTPEEIRAQINYQLGSTLQDIALQNYHYDLAKSDGVAFRVTLPRLEELVILLNELPPVRNKVNEELALTLQGPIKNAKSTKRISAGYQQPSETVPQITILQRPTKSVDLTLVDVRSSLQPIAVLTKHLAAACELELFASPDAQAIIAGRSRALDVNDIQASLLLDSLLLPLNLFWYQDETGLHLVSLLENDSHIAAYWSAAMERTFRRFNVAFPDDYRGESALLSRGNLNLIQGDFDRAANHYQELMNMNPKDELLARLFFNIGKVEMRLGRNESAIQNFYHTVDQTYDTGFQSTGYWLIGQLSLENNALEDAIRASGRALSTAKTDDQKRLAALTMSRAYLLSNQPFSANQILFNYRRSFAGTELEATASVLGCYARYVGVTDKSSLTSEANRLLAAVAMAPNNSYESFLDIYVAARAYLDLGFQAEGIEKLTLAANSTTIPAWRRQILFELGVQLMIADQSNEAIAVFEFLASGESDQWLEKSLLQLAQLYVRTKRLKDCLAICEQLSQRELSESDKQITLNSMGLAYRELGENHSAALCFAGMIPHKTTVE